MRDIEVVLGKCAARQFFQSVKILAEHPSVFRYRRHMPSDTKKPAQPIPIFDSNCGNVLGVLLNKNGQPICLSEEDIRDFFENPGPPLRDDEIPF